MTDLATAEAPETKSTTLDPNAPLGPSGGGAPKIAPENDGGAEAKPVSLRDTISEEMKKSEKPADDTDAAKGADGEEDGEAKGEKAKVDDKDKPEVSDKAAKPDADDVKKSDRGQDGKFKGKEDAPADAKNATKADDDKPGKIDPPKNFLPDAKETWRNTPRAVQRDVEQMARRHETEVTQLREATQRYESLRPFDELAKSNGHDLTESLRKMGEIEDGLRSNPIATLNRILIEAGPRKADGSPVTLREVAQFVAQQDDNGYNRIVSAQPQQQAPQNDNAEVAQLRQQLAAVQAQQVAAQVLEPFKAEHPRYDELKSDIAFFLKSGRIPADLSPADRLAAAYDMAERINPPSHDDSPATPPSPDADGRADPSGSSGSKSIKSAPGSVTSDLAPERGGSIRDLLSDEMKRQRRA